MDFSDTASTPRIDPPGSAKTARLATFSRYLVRGIFTPELTTQSGRSAAVGKDVARKSGDLCIRQNATIDCTNSSHVGHCSACAVPTVSTPLHSPKPSPQGFERPTHIKHGPFVAHESV